MDHDTRDRWSNVAHRHRAFCSPVDGARFTRFVAELRLPPSPHVVDLGCGKGEALRRTIELCGGSGTGVDHSDRMLRNGVTMPERIAFVRGDAATWRPDRPIDMAICIGSTHIFGGTAEAASALGALVQPGGTVLLGTGYWRSVPSAGELDSFGMDAGELTSLAGAVAAVEQANLAPFAVQTSSQAEWDDYEWSLIRSVESWAKANPRDPDCDAFTSRTRLMRETFLQWRRAAFGFALIAALKPAR